MSQTAKLPELTDEEKKLLQMVWPEDFGTLYQIGLKCYNELFRKDERFKNILPYELTGDEPAEWHKQDRFRKQALAFVQVLAKALYVFTLANGKQMDECIKELNEYLTGIGSLHRTIVPKLESGDFEFFLTLVPAIVQESEQAKKLTDEQRKAATEAWKKVNGYVGVLLREGHEKACEVKREQLKRTFSKHSMEGKSVLDVTRKTS